MTIYIDIVLLENLIMNFIILVATGLINKTQINYIRIFLSSLIGAIYSIIAYMNILPVYSNIVTKFVLSIIMVFVGFNPLRPKILMKQLLIFYLTSFAFGGCTFFLLYFIKPQDVLINNGVYIGSYPLKVAIIGGIVGFIVVTTAFKIIKNRMSRVEMFCNINIYYKNRCSKIKALIDSGNLLKEPITNMPVVIAETGSLYNILPQNILDNVDQIIDGNLDEYISDEYISKFRIIPFNSLGKQNGLLLGFKVDYIEIEIEDREFINNNVIIGIYNQNLNKANNYTGLIGLDLLEERRENYECFANFKK